jgi:hypothetical protein
MIHEHDGERIEADVCPICGLRLIVKEFPTEVLLRKCLMSTDDAELNEDCIEELARRIDQGKAEAERPSKPKPKVSGFYIASLPLQSRRWSIWGPDTDSPNTLTEGFGPARFMDGSIDPDCVIKFAEFSAVGFEEAARVFAVFRDGAVFDKVDA